MASFETRRRKRETSEPTFETPVMSNKLIPLNSTTKPKREAIADLIKLSPTSTLRIPKKPSSNRSTSTMKILEKRPSSSRSTTTSKTLEKKRSSNRSTSTSENREKVSKNRCVIRVSGKHRRSISPPSTSSLLCGICTDEKLKDDMFTIAGCDHSYCSDCVAKYVAAKFQENVVNITCPVPGCESSLDPLECQSILPKQVFDRWCDVLCESLVVGSEKLYCPFKDCSALLIDSRYDDEGAPECECPECHRLFCGECKVPWHASLTCKEYQKTLNKDESSSTKDNEDTKLIKLAKKKKWMRCPNCRFYVKRSGGCLFIKCRCGHGFCYNCGASMDDHYCKKCKH